MTRCLMWMAVGSLVFAAAAGASVRQGDTELDLLGGFTSQNGSDIGFDFQAWFISTDLGYFLTDNVQVQGSALGALTSTDTGSGDRFNANLLGVGGKAKYHFMPGNQLVPYLGAQLMWVSADVDSAIWGAESGTTEGTLWGPLAGLRFELNEKNDFFVEYQYQVWEGDLDRLWDDGHMILLGIIHQFK
jgi:hypothetical protein